jgi:hypothetical protein
LQSDLEQQKPVNMAKESVTIANIRQDEWVNPFGASFEELVAGALDESGLLSDKTTINGKKAQEFHQSLNKKRNLFQEATRLGSILVKEGLISNEQLNDALQIQANTSKPLGEILLAQMVCSQEDINRALERQKTIREELYRLEQTQEARRGIWNRIMRALFDSRVDV